MLKHRVGGPVRTGSDPDLSVSNHPAKGGRIAYGYNKASGEISGVRGSGYGSHQPV